MWDTNEYLHGVTRSMLLALIGQYQIIYGKEENHHLLYQKDGTNFHETEEESKHFIAIVKKQDSMERSMQHHEHGSIHNLLLLSLKQDTWNDGNQDN